MIDHCATDDIFFGHTGCILGATWATKLRTSEASFWPEESCKKGFSTLLVRKMAFFTLPGE